MPTKPLPPQKGSPKGQRAYIERFGYDCLAPKE